MRASQKPKKTFFLRREKKTNTMKKLSFLNKLIFILNSLCALLLLLGYILPYAPPSVFPKLSVLSLLLPVLLITNFVFLIYWLLRLKRQFLLSALILLLGIHHITALYNFGDAASDSLDNIKLMSYNLRAFAIQGNAKKQDVQKSIYEFIKKEDPVSYTHLTLPTILLV